MITPHHNPRRSSVRLWPPTAGGITLIETVISTLVVSVMMVAALQMLGSSATADRVYAAKRGSPPLAAQLMAEILATNYADTGASPTFGLETGESGVTRSDFDDVDDYHGWSAAPQEKDGAAISNLSGWTRSVTVQYVDPDDVSSVVGSDQGMKLITITLKDPAGRLSSSTALRGNSSTYDFSPAVSTSYVNWVGVTVQVGFAEQSRVSAGANPLNSVPIAVGN